MLKRSLAFPALCAALLVLAGGGPILADCSAADGSKLNVQDATQALRFAVGIASPTADQLACYDLSPYPGSGDRLYGDGALNIQDVVLILRLAVGLETSLPADNSQLFTLNGGAGFSVPGSASLVDLAKFRAGDATGAVTARAFQTGSVPNDMAFDGGKGYLVNSTGNSIQAVDLATSQTIGTPLFLGYDANEAPNPMKVAVANHKAYVTLLYDNSVAVVDLSTMKVTQRISVGVSPQGIATNGTQVIVTNTGFTWDSVKNVGVYQPGSLSVIDSTTDKVIGTVSAPLNPVAAKIAPDGRLNVACTGNYGDDPGSIAVYNLLAGGAPTLAGTVSLGGSPGSLAFSPTGSAYVGNSAGGLLEYDYKTLKIIHGTDQPISLQPATETAESPTDLTSDTRGVIYAALFGKDRVVALDSKTDAVKAEIPVGDGPEALAIR